MVGGKAAASWSPRRQNRTIRYCIMLAVRHVSRPMMIRLVPEVMKGTHGRFKQVRMGHFSHMSLQADRPLYIHIDGEIYAGFGVDVAETGYPNFPQRY